MKYKLLSCETIILESDSLQDIFSFIEARTWLAFNFLKEENGNRIPLTWEAEVNSNGISMTLVENIKFDTKLVVSETLDVDKTNVLLALKDASQIPNIKQICASSKNIQYYSGEGVPFLTQLIDERVRYNYTIIEDGTMLSKWEVKIKFE